MAGRESFTEDVALVVGCGEVASTLIPALPPLDAPPPHDAPPLAFSAALIQGAGALIFLLRSSFSSARPCLWKPACSS